jgi:CRP-like cAMP-binding protein
MNIELFFQKIRTYYPISAAAETAWAALLREKHYQKGENLINEGQVRKKVSFVVEGLFSQYYASENGETVIKYFFPEGRLAASVTAMLTEKPSLFIVYVLNCFFT